MQTKNEQINSLTHLNEELENYFRNTIIPQLFVDAGLILRKFIPPAMKQFQLQSEDLGKPLAEIEENFRFPTFIENIQQVILSGEILEKEIQTTDLRWYQMNILPYLVRNENRTNGVIITFVDVTARIKDLKEQEKLVLERELLLDTITHDIKTPLTTLGLSIEMMKKLPAHEREKFPQLLGKVETGLQKIKIIIQDLIDSRWSEHRHQEVEEILDLQNILEDVRLTLALQIQEAQANFIYDIKISQIKFSRRKLRSIVYNLVNNAIKYRSSERALQITICTFQLENFLVISVKDNGVGIETAAQQKVFNKYQRINNNVEGNGVGLYLVREMIESCGGRIELQSEAGMGSVFEVHLKSAV